ncbi:MAG: hypothetical protein WD735_02500 [Balneolaceae bacterium]
MDQYFSQQADQITELLLMPVQSDLQDPVLQIELINDTDETLQDLYLEISIGSENFEELLQISLNENSPFIMESGANIQFTNKELAERSISGMAGNQQFDFVISESARRLINSIQQGITPLPDRFLLDVSVYQNNPESNGGNEIASEAVAFDVDVLSQKLMITASETGIENLSNLDLRVDRPVFQWNGNPDQTYRLVVVEDTPEKNEQALLRQSFNQALNDTERTNLNEFEYLDVLVTGDRYEYPAERNKPLEHGKDYAWQVQTTVLTPNGEQTVTSDIWKFSLHTLIEAEVRDLLVTLFGNEKVEQMIANGMQLDQIEIGDTVYTNNEAVEYLKDLVSKVDENKVVIVN